MDEDTILHDDARPRGLMVWGSPGAGKSVFLGNTLVAQEHQRGKPVVVWDIIGTVTDYFLATGQTERIIYADMAAREYVVGFPLYYRMGSESLFEIAQRFLEVIRLSDPAILVAPIHGYNPILVVGTNTGMILTALGLPITNAVSLLDTPELWTEKFKEAVDKNPEASPAVEFFLRQYIPLSRDKRATLSQPFRIKLLPFLNDPSLQAICCATTPGINWSEVIEKGQTVLLDFRYVTNEQKKSFLLLWTLKTLLSFIQSRGRQ